MSVVMQTILSAVVVAVIMLEGGRCIQWTAGPDDGDKIYVCEEQDLTLPWSVSLNQGEDITRIEWLFDGKKDPLIAYYAKDMFVQMPSYSGRLQHLPMGGLRLSHVTPVDEGTYTVKVCTDDGSGRHQTYKRSASVHVATEVTARTDVTLDIKQQARATYDDTTGQYYLQLTCTSRGLQPLSVIWTTPSQQEVNSSITDSNGFSLLLPKSVTGGHYSCRVPLDAPAAKCLSGSDPALEGASMHVNNMEARMTIMEAEQEMKSVQMTMLRQETTSLRQETSSLREKTASLHEENSNLRQTVQALKSVQLTALRQETSSLRQETSSIREKTASLHEENSNLRQTVQALKNTTSKQVLFNVYLTSQTTPTDGHTLVFPGVSVNQGSGYSTSTGRFTAPYSGHYYFSATAAAGLYSTSSDYYANLRLMVDGFIATAILTKSVNYYEMGSLHYGVHLTQGKQVWLQSLGYRTFYGSNFHLTTFSGFLVSAD